MAIDTNIEWCDSTFNGWIGCTKISPGCDHCYAEGMNNRFKGGNWGPGAQRKRTSSDNWNEPLKWNRRAHLFRQCGYCGWRGVITVKDEPEAFGCPSCNGVDWRPARRRVFCASMADWLDKDVPIIWLADLLNLIRSTPNLDWLLLTKRIGSWKSRMMNVSDFGANEDAANFAFEWLDGNPPKHVLLGATVVNQTEADRDLPKLLSLPATAYFTSIEPMLGPINIAPYVARFYVPPTKHYKKKPCSPFGLDWVIAGAESGHGARPSDFAWYRALRDQCADERVPLLIKQLPGINGKVIKDLEQFPKDLRVRQFPASASL